MVRQQLSPPLLSTAVDALRANRRYGLTVPHRRMFPAGYLWDTAVIAQGLAVLDTERAAAEILRFLGAQWTTGMLPNEAYFERRRMQDRVFGRHPDAPAGLTTSGITQPPTIVRAALEVARRLTPDDRDAFVTAALPSLAAYCRWLVERRVGESGLAVVIHPYETGMDNRIDLAEALGHEWHPDPDADDWTHRATRAALGAMRRRLGDTRTVPLHHRSSHQDVIDAHRQTRHIRSLGYDLDAVVASGRGLLVEDVGFNAVLVDALACLQELAAERRPDSADGPGRADASDGLDALAAAARRVAAALEGLWVDAAPGRRPGYYSRDHRTGAPLLRPTVAGLLPLLATRDPARVAALTGALLDESAYWTTVAPPSAPVDSEGFIPDRYWRGPAWSFPTDLVETGLRLQGLDDVAARLRRRYLERPHGPLHAEYENPLTGAALGARPFSPAAALAIRFADAEGLGG